MVALIALTIPMLLSCARIGHPEGGPRDYTPPVLVAAKPVPGATNFNGNKVELRFDEYIQLKDQQTKVVVSPVQKEAPIIRAQGKKITIEFRDTMKQNTTYVIDFSNAIQDNNENMPLEGFTHAFSTGDSIDTLQISGMVLRAKDLEPMQHVIVGLHSNLNDSALTTLPFERISRTNDRGEFTLRNLKPGSYHVFALRDVDGDYKMARTEDVAFLDEVIVPSVTEFTSTDTIFTFDKRIDSIYTATHTDYLPNDILLSMFNEEYKSLYLDRTQRLSNNRLWVKFSTKVDTLPTLQPVKPIPHRTDWFRLERRADNDSLVYWLTDSTLIKADSVVVAMTYLHTDSTEALSLKTDTVTFWQRKSNSQLKQEAQEKKDREKQEKDLAKALANIEKAKSEDKEPSPEDIAVIEADEQRRQKAMPRVNISFDGPTLGIMDSISMKVDVPIYAIDPAGVHLEHTADSVWLPVEDAPQLQLASEYEVLRYVVPMTLDPKYKYRLTIDSLAITSVYDSHNLAPVEQEFTVKGTEEYANLYFRIKGVENAIVQLVDNADKVICEAPAVNGEAALENIEPGTFYARLFVDRNGNGKWDTGNYAQHRQPEETYYYPKKLRLRKNWDIDETWNVFETPVNLMKLDEIKRNKPEKSKRLEPEAKKDPNREEDEDEFNSSGFTNGIYSGDKYRDNRNGYNY